MKTAKNTDKQLRSFSRVMAIAFVVIGVMLMIRKKPEFWISWTISAVFYAAGAARPQWLGLAFGAWMGLARVLSWINTRILLIVIFYGIMTPAGIIMKLFGFDPLERKFEKSRQSYWHQKQKKAFSRSDYERLY